MDVMGLFADGQADGEDEWEADAKPVPLSLQLSDFKVHEP